MKRLLKILGVSVASLVGLIVVAVGALYAWTGRQLAKELPVTSHDFAVTSDSTTIARGEHVAMALGKCTDCHGADYGGTTMVDDAAFGRLVSANLTRGQGGIGGTYTDADWERAVRHGLSSTGRRLMVMPSNEFQFLSDEDLNALIAYLRSVPPVDRAALPTALGPVARGLYAAGIFPLFAATSITHGDEKVASVPVDTSVAYGEYLTKVGCVGCHGEGFGGGKIPGAPPEFPATANITPTGIGHYTYEQFNTVIRTGVRPDGTKLHEFMPVKAIALMTDTESRAVWAYLRTVPPKEFGTR